MIITNPIGIIGEEEAMRMMKSEGYTILEHNWTIGRLEIDIIAENKKEIVFVEVKARTSSFGNLQPEQYVDEMKRRRVIAAANAYMKKKKVTKTPRFDIIGIIVNATTQTVVERHHLVNAFHPVARTISSGSFAGKWQFKKRKTK